jgi:hypothetical protein
MKYITAQYDNVLKPLSFVTGGEMPFYCVDMRRSITHVWLPQRISKKGDELHSHIRHLPGARRRDFRFEMCTL